MSLVLDESMSVQKVYAMKSYNTYHNYINILTSKTQCQVKVWLCLYINVVTCHFIIKGSEK